MGILDKEVVRKHLKEIETSLAYLKGKKNVKEGDLANMAKFRNILVHEYVKVETKRLISFLKNDLGDFEAFAKAVARFTR